MRTAITAWDGDIDAFMAALSGPADYQTRIHCDWFDADCNHDARVDFADINLFLDRVMAGCGAPCLTAKLLPTDGAADDRFGQAVAVDGDIAVVGAYDDDDLGNNAVPRTGSAYGGVC